MSEVFDDENFDDGFDDHKLSKRLNVELWKKLFGYASRYPTDLKWLAATAFTTALCEVTYPLLTKGVIDAVDGYLKTGMEPGLFLWGLGYLFCTMLLALSVGIFIWRAGSIRTSVAHDIRRDGFENLQRLSFSYFDYRPVGWLMARMTSDCERLSNILAWGFLDLVWGSTMMLGIALAMFIMDWKLALLVFSILPFLGWVSSKFQKSILTSARAVRATNSRITGNFNEGIMGVQTTKAFVREEDNQKEFGELAGAMYRSSVSNMTLAAIYLPIVVTLASLATGLALAVGGMDTFAGIIPISTLIAFMAYTRHFFDPIETLGHWFAEMQMAQASAERILSLIGAEPEIKDSSSVLRAIEIQKDRANPNSVWAEDGGSKEIQAIELNSVSFAYDPKKPVLNKVSLKAQRDDVIAVVGPTGGGKSTLVNIISRFYQPTAGEVLIDGVDYKNRSLRWLQSNIGIVLQNAHVFAGSILENIRYGKLEASDEEVVQAARLVGADEFIGKMPEGYQSDAGESGGLLSAGQKQLISFARAILSDPQVLVMDEATSSVDTETEQVIQQGLRRVLEGRIAFIIAHRLSTIRNATRIIVIDHGSIIEEGSHETLMKKRGHYYELYRQQSRQEASRQLG